MDRTDWAATIGFGAVIAGALFFDLEGPLLAAILGGFVLSLALSRVYDGRIWEALGWLTWLVAAMLLAFGLENPVLYGAFLGTILLGFLFQYGDRFDLLPDVWTDAREE